jgi:manganese transport protein
MELTTAVRRLGPTWLAGAIAAGPATMASLLAAGVGFGYSLLWLVVLSAAFGALAQYLAARLALHTGEGIVTTVERRLGDGWAWLLVGTVLVASGLAQLIIMKTVADVSALVTGFDARVWGVAWAVILAAGLAGGGYRVAEVGAKLVVSAVVLAFVVSLFVVPLDVGGAAAGLVPSLPAGSALVAAGILGGAVHITLITMQSYTMRARGWTEADAGVARFDIATSMLGAFGVYSLAIFLVAAGVLQGVADPATLSATTAAQALGPLAGQYAETLFLLGLWGAAVSTLGGNTVVPPYLLADKLGWETDVSDGRYRALVAGVALLSAGGAFVGGAFLPLLVLVLAFGLVGTPFAVTLVLYLLSQGEESLSVLESVGALALVAVTAVTAGAFVQGRLESVTTDPMSALVVGAAVVLTAATLVLLGKTVAGRVRATPTGVN